LNSKPLTLNPEAHVFTVEFPAGVCPKTNRLELAQLEFFSSKMDLSRLKSNIELGHNIPYFLFRSNSSQIPGKGFFFQKST